MTPEEVITNLRETYAGRSSLRDAWLTWSHRANVLSVERFEAQLRTMGYNIDDEAASQIMMIIGSGDLEEGLSYNGFLRLVVGDQATMR